VLEDWLAGTLPRSRAPESQPLGGMSSREMFAEAPENPIKRAVGTVVVGIRNLHAGTHVLQPDSNAGGGMGSGSVVGAVERQSIQDAGQAGAACPPLPHLTTE